MSFDDYLVRVDSGANLTGVDLVNVVVAEKSTNEDQFALEPLLEAVQVDVLGRARTFTWADQRILLELRF